MRILLIAASLLVLATAAPAEEITVAAAADLQYAMQDLSALFEKSNPDTKLQVTYGSSGNFVTQIKSGAPFDLFLSADTKYAEALSKEGFAKTAPKIYAIGRIVLWTRKDSGVDLRKKLEALIDPKVQTIAIANPQHAPYGQRAKQALVHYQLWKRVEKKLVLGENVAQAAQFLLTGNAQVGIISLSLAQSPPLKGSGYYYQIPDEAYEPLEQAYVVLKGSEKKAGVLAFAKFLEGKEAQKVLKRYGFSIPKTEAELLKIEADKQKKLMEPKGSKAPGKVPPAVKH